jgi:hypothetical protein
MGGGLWRGNSSVLSRVDNLAAEARKMRGQTLGKTVTGSYWIEGA